MNPLASLLVLPHEITLFERRYLGRVNRIALPFFAAHVPIFMLIAALNGTRPWLALVLTSFVLVGPALAYRTFENPRLVSIVHGVAAMFMGGLLVHFGQGPMQIEMHFYFFALVAMCAVFGNPMVIVAAAVTVALHHVVVWMVLPRSVFNYDASIWVVLVHAAFVVLESVATCFIARSFFDNVIGLERIVLARTAELDAKNRDMRLLLDSVQQGFLTIDQSGGLASERSAAVDAGFGAPAPGATWFDWLETVSPRFAAQTRLGWEAVVEDFLPLVVTLAQMPARLTVGNAILRVEYHRIGTAADRPRTLVIVTDITADVAREVAETERREGMAVFERVLADRSGFELFLEESATIVRTVTRPGAKDLAFVKRLLHTLKGNAALYGLASVSTLCHRLEDIIAESGALPDVSAYKDLEARWNRIARDVEALLGPRRRAVEVTEAQLEELESAVRAEQPRSAIARRIRALKLEPAEKRLQLFAEQARRTAERFDKPDLSVRVEDNGVRLDGRRWAGFWTAFSHAVRNAIAHGIEAPDERLTVGKKAQGELCLRTRTDDDRLIVEVADDGRGIDWSEVAKRAQAADVPFATAADLEAALFADGVSTATSVTEIAGRGVGMGALRDATRALGGEIGVTSQRNGGTTVRMTFPLRAEDEPLSRALTARSAPTRAPLAVASAATDGSMGMHDVA
jgi:two-component system chemotaxis sensor kinase CheA